MFVLFHLSRIVMYHKIGSSFFTAFKVDQHMIVGFNVSVTLFSFCMKFEQEADTKNLIES